MDTSVKKELEKNIAMINSCLNFVLENELLNNAIKQEFDSIRILLDYCESLAINGKDAIETL